jgi:uncharacterized UBP type Zn finger protein
MPNFWFRWTSFFLAGEGEEGEFDDCNCCFQSALHRLSPKFSRQSSMEHIIFEYFLTSSL